MTELTATHEHDLAFTRLSIDDQRWRAFVAAHPESTAFHDPRWVTLLSECYGFPAFAAVILDRSGAVRGGTPVLEVRRVARRKAKWVSLPFTDACPPLLEPGTAPTFLRELERQRRDADIAYVELRGGIPGYPGMPSLSWTGHVLELGMDYEAVYARFASGIRRDIIAAARLPVVVRRATDEQDLTEVFYSLHAKTRRRLGVPVQPRRFFRLLWRDILVSGGGFALLAMVGEHTVSGAVFLHANGTLTYKYSATDPNYSGLNASKSLLSEAIRWGCEAGQSMFDFGRSPPDAEGLRRFKSRFGARDTAIDYYLLGCAQSTRAVPREWKLPSKVLRRGPLWLTRLAGEALYKHAA